MSYCTQTDIEKIRIPVAKLVQLTDDANLDIVDAAVVAGAIADADGLINGFLRGRYPLPLSPVPDIIKTISLDITTYYLYTRKPEFEEPVAVSDKHKVAIKLLERIQDGKMELVESTPVTSAGSNDVQVTAPERVFSRDTLADY